MAEPARPVPVYTVADLVAGLRELLEERVGRVWVVGEVADLHKARSGHSYFTLRDGGAQIRAALFRNTAIRLPFEPENGLEVLVYGELTVYEARGDLQLVIRQLEPRGEGALRLAFEQLRRRLEAEGLFDPARKREAPDAPRCIGVVTSPTGAALHDVLQVTGRRCPGVPIRIAPTLVQGAGAERGIVAAIEALGACEDVDVILVVRGGGSLEDLQAFNTEAVARAIAAAPVPVISGVGHEVDVSIADLAADVRAPTPSAAAELVAPDREELRRTLEADWARLVRAGRIRLERAAARLARAGDAVERLAPAARLAEQRARLDALARVLPRAIESIARLRGERLRAAGRSLPGAVRAQTERRRSRLAELAARLESLSPLAVLGRGYALVRRTSDGALVRRSDELAVGDRIAVRLAEAELEASVSRVRDLRTG